MSRYGEANSRKYPKSFRTRIIGSIVVIAGIVAALPAHAALVTYEVDSVAASFPSPITAPTEASWGKDGYPGDSVQLQSYTGQFDLSPGTSSQLINSLLWTVNPTYAGTNAGPWTNYEFTVNASRVIHIGASATTLSQTGTLAVTYFSDTLAFSSNGPTASLLFNGYKIDITPQSLPSALTADDFGIQSPQPMYAQFVITPVPEPETYGMMMVGLGLMGFMVRRRKNNQA